MEDKEIDINEIEEGFEEEIPVNPWRRILQVTAGLVFIAAILFISGIYQYSFFTRTPDTAKPREYQQIISGDVINLPSSIYIIQPDDGFMDDEERLDLKTRAENISINASRILSQAGISVDLKDVEIVEMNTRGLSVREMADHIMNLPLYNPDEASIILSRTLSGLNGLAFMGQNTLFVAEYTAGFDYRTLAHEIGHILGLGHTQEPGRLMVSGGRGERISTEEALIMRQNASKIANTE